MADPALLNAEKAALLVGVTPRSVRLKAESGSLPVAGYTRRGGRLFNETDCLLWRSARASVLDGGRKRRDQARVPKREMSDEELVLTAESRDEELVRA